MKEVEFNIDHGSDMLSITIEGKLNFFGNFWDFSRPTDIIRLVESLGCKVKVNEQDFEDWSRE